MCHSSAHLIVTLLTVGHSMWQVPEAASNIRAQLHCHRSRAYLACWFIQISIGSSIGGGSEEKWRQGSWQGDCSYFQASDLPARNDLAQNSKSANSGWSRKASSAWWLRLLLSGWHSLSWEVLPKTLANEANATCPCISNLMFEGWDVCKLAMREMDCPRSQQEIQQATFDGVNFPAMAWPMEIADTHST